MERNIYVYILAMAGVTALIRILPLTLIRRDIRNVTIRSFLYYVPYVTLSAMTFPAILGATRSTWSALAALAADVVLAWRGKSLFAVSVAGCVVALVTEFVLGFFGAL